jgi:hypothetical protein
VRSSSGGAAPSAARRAVAAAARLPALHFLVLGASLAAWNAATDAPAAPAARAPIVITAARVAALRDDYARTVATPSADELAALVAREADEEMLYREALLLGLDRGDRAVKWRLVEKMHFLYGDAAGDAETAYRRGLALGLAEDDVVVRNALVTKMRLLAKAASRQEEPAGPALERELEAFLATHADAYRRSERLTLTHVFLSAATRGATLDADAKALAARLRAERPPAADAIRLGDPFLAGASFRATTPRALAKTFGERFAAAAPGSPPRPGPSPARPRSGAIWSGSTAGRRPTSRRSRPSARACSAPIEPSGASATSPA